MEIQITDKKRTRMENKKRKLKSLLTIMELNEADNKTKSLTSLKEGTENDIKMDEPQLKRFRESSVGDTEVNNTNATVRRTKHENMTDDEYWKLKQELKERKIYLNRIPRIKFREEKPTCSNLDLSSDKRIPLFMQDIQHMLAYLLFGPYLKPYNEPPSWCVVERQTRISNVTFVIVEGFSVNDYENNKDKFSFLSGNDISTKVAVINSKSYDGDVISELIGISLPEKWERTLKQRYRNLETYFKDPIIAFKIFKPAFNIRDISSDNNTLSDNDVLKPTTDNFPRTELLLSLKDQVMNNYPVPIKGSLSAIYGNYVNTKDMYSPVTASSPMFGLDCEMCQTTKGDELTRITIVNEQCQAIYERLVKPRNKIIDYRTRYSGITKEMLKDVTTTLDEVQNDLRNLLPDDAILIGHSLNSDLNALQMMHPYVIDSSCIYNLTMSKGHKQKLKYLTKHYLDWDIQMGENGHDSNEDAIAALKLVQHKLSKDLAYGDNTRPNEEEKTISAEGDIYNELPRSVKSLDDGVPKITTSQNNADIRWITSIFNSLITSKVPSTIVAKKRKLEQFRELVTQKYNEDSLQFLSVTKKRERIDKLREAMVKGRYFSLAHMKIKELKKDSYFSKVDNWCSKLWAETAIGNVMVVLFTSSPDPTANGVCFAGAKRPSLADIRANTKPRLDR